MEVFCSLALCLPIFVTAIFLTRRIRWMRVGAVTLFALITFESYFCVRDFDIFTITDRSPGNCRP